MLMRELFAAKELAASRLMCLPCEGIEPLEEAAVSLPELIIRCLWPVLVVTARKVCFSIHGETQGC